MLVTLGVSPDCFGPTAVTQVEERYAAERVLEALLQNALVLTMRSDFAAAVSGRVSDLPLKLGQQLRIRSAEFLKVGKQTVRAIPMPREVIGVVGSLVAAAKAGADAVICASASEVMYVRAALGASPTEVCTLAEYPESRTEALRQTFRETVELHTLACAKCRSVFARALSAGERIVVADKMLGRAGKDGYITTPLERFARGVVFLAECARDAGSAAPEIDVVTLAGNVPGTGYVDPAKAERAIRGAIGRVDPSGDVSRLSVTLKADTDPAIFRDRLFACGGRCWGIRHGVDDLGHLKLEPAKRSPTYLDPDTVANRRLLSSIQNLNTAT